MGIPSQNIIVWPKNGIEYFYPDEILNEIFGDNSSIVIADDKISRNGIIYTKNDLAEEIIRKMNLSTKMNAEFEKLFLKKIESLLN